MPAFARTLAVGAATLLLAWAALAARDRVPAQGADPGTTSGKEIFTGTAQPPCALCHTLADAGAAGEIGPNLDELRPTAEMVRKAVEGGVGNMPAYDDTLSERQIASVARYVAQVTSAR
ncbi:cytochrome c [Xanthobacteraceae bacterium Astr-EGSB]|uniref:SorU family sulfite dehydrogenase c-type cytochrome subunit n=1 Tax=Astrobacterium formosum TaxID=3069710 RepID=UPI0027B59312|nr:cytochrome c [Xanthobacteraceae bacterium Astr-EGSB]